MASYKSGNGPLKTMLAPNIAKRPPPALSTLPQPAPAASPRPAPPHISSQVTISSPIKHITSTPRVPQHPASAPQKLNSPTGVPNFSPYRHPIPKAPTSTPGPMPVLKSAPQPTLSTAMPAAPPVASALAEEGPDSFPIDDELNKILLAAEQEAERKMAAAAVVSVPAPGPSVAEAATSAQATVPAATDETARAAYQAEISALKYKLQIREQEAEKTKQELRNRHAACGEAEKKVTQLSAQLAFRNQELRELDISLEQARHAPTVPTQVTPPTQSQVAIPAAAGTTQVRSAEPKRDEEMSEQSLTRDGATEEEEIQEPNEINLGVQRERFAKAAQRSPQKKRKTKTATSSAVLPSSAEKKRRMDSDPVTNAPPAEVDNLKKKLRACTSRLQSVKRALNGEYDANETSVVAMVGVEAPTATSSPVLSKEVQLLKEQLAQREELFRLQEEARKVDLQEKEAAMAALKRMEEAENTMNQVEAERLKTLAALQEVKVEAQKMAEERLEALRALAKAEKQCESFLASLSAMQLEVRDREERLEAQKQELVREKLQNEELGNECAVARAARDIEARRATKAEKECEETRTRLFSMEQRCADAARQIHEDALRMAHTRRKHEEEMMAQRVLYDEQLKKLAVRGEEKAALKLEVAERQVEEHCSAPM